MTLLFIFFALPIATILLAIVLQKVLGCPILVAITFFAIYLIASFVAFSDFLTEALIATIIYTVIAFITAYLARVIGELIKKVNSKNRCCSCEEDENVAFNANIIPNSNNAGTTGSIRGRYRRF